MLPDSMPRSLRFIALYRTPLAALFLLPLPAVAQSAPVQGAGLQALQQQLMAPPATVTLNARELRLSRLNRADLRVEDGAIHLRMQNTLMQTGTDDILHQNDSVHVRKVEGTTEKKVDCLRITVGADDGQAAPVTFEVPKGSLAGMSVAALQQLVAPIFILSGAGTGPGPAPDSAAAVAAPEQPMAPIAPPAPPPDEPAPPSQPSRTPASAKTARIAAHGPAPPRGSAADPGDIAPLANVWVSHRRTSKSELSEEAVTRQMFTHGIAMVSMPDVAILSCRQEGGKPTLTLTAQVPLYPGYSPTGTGKFGHVIVGRSQHDVTVQQAIGGAFFTVSTVLNDADAAELSGQELINSDLIGFSFPGDFHSSSDGNLPPANAALDAVLNGCHITTPQRSVVLPGKELTPDEVQHLQLAKVTLGMSPTDVQQVLGPSFRYLPSSNTQQPSVTYLLAADSSGGYGFTFIKGILKAFSFGKIFPAGGQPLALNLIHGVTEKTWLPLSGSSLGATSWSSDANGIPITVATESSHPTCRRVNGDRQTAAPGQGGFSRLLLVSLSDPGPNCGVTAELQIQPGQQDKAMAGSMVLMVADYTALHALVSGVMNQRQEQRDAQRTRAGQVASPF